MPHATPMQKLGRRLQMARKTRGWTQERLAKRVHISRAYLARLETGRQRIANFSPLGQRSPPFVAPSPWRNLPDSEAGRQKRRHSPRIGCPGGAKRLRVQKAGGAENGRFVNRAFMPSALFAEVDDVHAVMAFGLAAFAPDFFVVGHSEADSSNESTWRFPVRSPSRIRRSSTNAQHSASPSHVKTLTTSPVRTSHTLIVLSSEAESIRPPSELKDTPLIFSVCPLNVRSNFPDWRSHAFNVLSSDADITRRPSGPIATAFTLSEWPFSVWIGRPVSRSQTTTAFHDPVMAVRPSEATATATTQLE